MDGTCCFLEIFPRSSIINACWVISHRTFFPLSVTVTTDSCRRLITPRLAQTSVRSGHHQREVVRSWSHRKSIWSTGPTQALRIEKCFFRVIGCGFVVRVSINYCFVVQKQMLIGLLQWKRSCASEYCYSVVWKGQEKQLIGFGHDW